MDIRGWKIVAALWALTVAASNFGWNVPNITVGYIDLMAAIYYVLSAVIATSPPEAA